MYSSLLPLTIGLFLLRKQKCLEFRLLLSFATLLVIHEAAGYLTVYMGTRNNIWLSHLFTPLESGVLAAIYYFNFRKPWMRRGIEIGWVALVLVSIYDAYMLGGITQMNSAPKMMANALLILLAIAYFYKVANDRNIIYLDSNPVFLLSCAVLIYYSGTSMSYALFNQALAVSYDAARICLAIVLILNILFNTSQAFILKRMAA